MNTLRQLRKKHTLHYYSTQYGEKYIIMHFTLCYFVDLDNFGHEKEEAEEQMEEEEKADAAVEDVTLEHVVEITEGTGPRSGTLMKISKKQFQTIDFL